MKRSGKTISIRKIDTKDPGCRKDLRGGATLVPVSVKNVIENFKLTRTGTTNTEFDDAIEPNKALQF
jgi:hypothetical protein